MTKSSLKNVVSAADRALLQERYEFVPSQPNDPTATTPTIATPTTQPTTTTSASTWQDRMVQRYQEGLYREYALADLSRPGQLGLRWRTQAEVMQGRGERSCGNKRCVASSNLVTVEVPFAYVEGGKAKKELVKLNLCPTCLPLVQKQRESLSGSSNSESSSSSSSLFAASDKKKRKRQRSRHRRKNHDKKSKH